jgi:cytochrome c553
MGAAAVVLVVACGNGTSDSLSLPSVHGAGASGGAGSGGVATTSTGSSGGGSGGESSHDASTGGVVSTGGGADGGASADAASPGETLFAAMFTALNSTCGGPCHSQGAGGAPLWLGPPDPYTSAVKYPGIVVSDPGASILLTKGRHEGPPLQDPLLTQVEQWLAAEAQALAPVVLPSSAPFTPQVGANDVDCSPAGIPGVHVTFSAAMSGDILTLSSLTLVAPTATGVHVTYPIFAMLPPGGAPEVDDSSFSNTDETVAAGQSSPLGPGLLILTDWIQGAQMKVEFTAIAKAAATDGGLTGGCKALATFTSDAVPAIQANQCLTCHGAGGSGNAAMDLSGLASNPPNDATACAQALAQANPANPAQSEIILAPTGQVANHPFQGASQSFVTMMETWIAAEK